MVDKPNTPSALQFGRLVSRYVAGMQGGYYLISGNWPLLNMATFLAVTGPKTDLWLVRTVGLLLVVIGAVLVTAVVRRRIDLPIAVLGGCTAVAFVGIELVYVFNGTLSAIYLVDALLQMIFIVGWVTRQAVIFAGLSP